MDTKQHKNPKVEKENDKPKGKSPLAAGLGFAVAVALGATLGVIFAPKEGSKTQKDIIDKAQELAKKFKKGREDIQKNVEQIFGEVSEDLEKSYLELQGNILAQWDHIEDQGELTQKNYKKIVDDTIKEFSKGKKWSEKALKNLKENFEQAWEDLK